MLTNSLNTLNLNNNYNNNYNNYDEIVRNMVFIDWHDIKWNILSDTNTGVYRNFDDEFESIPERYLNTFAFPDDAARCLNQNIEPYEIELNIPSCGCRNCDNFIKLSLTQINAFTSVKELLNAIFIEYSERKIKIYELCKNDVEPFIKNALNLLNQYIDVSLCSVMDNIIMFDNISKYDGKYYLNLKTTF